MAFKGSNKISAPCYKCEKRVPGCHAVCEPYKKYAEERKNEIRAYDERIDPVDKMIFDKKKKRRQI